MGKIKLKYNINKGKCELDGKYNSYKRELQDYPNGTPSVY